MSSPAELNSAKPKTAIKNILILQGGGALGAYECGVYKALAEGTFLDHLEVVAGTSIGGINAGLIAKHFQEEDHGARFLERFWRGDLANESVPFFPPLLFPLMDYLERWNAVLTSYVAGHRNLFSPDGSSLVPWIWRPPIAWACETHFYDATPMEELLARPGVFVSYNGATPRLIVTAVDVAKGESVAFDSAKETLSVDHLVAGASLPPSYPAKAVNGAHYWDGGIWSNTPLRDVLNTLKSTRKEEIRYRVCIVDTFPKESAGVPTTNAAVFHRLGELTYADKTRADVTSTEWVNEYIDLVLTLEEFGPDLPPVVKEAIASMKSKQLSHYQEILDHTRIHVDIVTIPRKPYPDAECEEVSGEIDFSPERIDELIGQGYEAGRTYRAALEATPIERAHRAPTPVTAPPVSPVRAATPTVPPVAGPAGNGQPGAGNAAEKTVVAEKPSAVEKAPAPEKTQALEKSPEGERTVAIVKTQAPEKAQALEKAPVGEKTPPVKTKS